MKRALVAVALVMTANTASADESASGTAAALFKEGRALLQQGRYADACERFARSDRLEPSVGARLSLGECHEGLGESASAWVAYNEATALAMQRNDAARADVARKRAAWLEPRLAHLTVHVTNAIPNIVVTRNGTRIDPAAYDVAMPVDAGPQAVEATANGYSPWRTSIDIHDGDQRIVSVPVLSSEPDALPPRRGEGDSHKSLALGLEVGGGVAIASGLVLGLVAMSKWSSIEDRCPEGHCPTNAERDRLAPDASTARTISIASTITTCVGLVALAAGLYLHLAGGGRP